MREHGNEVRVKRAAEVDAGEDGASRGTPRKKLANDPQASFVTAREIEEAIQP